MFSDKQFGLPGSLIAAVTGVLSESKDNTDAKDAKKMKGGKTSVDLEPKTDDDTRDYDDKKSMKESAGTHPKSEKEKKLAALASPKDKITHKDVLVGRGVVKEEDLEEGGGTFNTVYRSLMADPRQNRVDDMKKKMRALPPGISDERKKYAIEIEKLERQMKAEKEKKVKFKEETELTEEDFLELEETLKKADPAGKWISDFVHSDDPKFKGKSPEKRKQMALAAYYAKQRNEEVEEMEEAKLSPEDFMKGARRAGTGTTAELKASLEKKRKGPGSGKIRQLDKAELKRRNEEVELSDEELERIEAIAQSLDEAKPTIVSAPIRGANQDQSGENTKSTSTDYTISDSKKMKEEVELDEDKIYFKHKSGVKGEIEKLGRNYVTKIKGAIPGYGHISQKHHNTRIDAENHMKKIGFHKEEVELDEAIKIGTKVLMHAPGKDYHGQTGRIGEINHGLYKGAPKKYTVDYGTNKSVQLDKNKIKLHKEEVELDEAKRGRPKKNPTPDDEQEEHEHVIMQLRKVVSTHGALPVKHLDGKSTKITPQLAQHALNKHSAMKTAAEKQDFETKLHKSHDSMKSALGQ